MTTTTLTDTAKESVDEAIAAALGDAYDCTRVWSAWSYGTMGPDDFLLVADDSDRLREITDAAIQAVLQSPEVQALRKDAERLRYILDRVCMIQAASYGCKFEILNLPPHFGDCEPDPVAPFLSAIDAAMQEQKT